MCSRCQQWGTEAIEVWLNVHSQAAKVQALQKQVLPHLLAFQSQMVDHNKRILSIIDNIADVPSRILALTSSCPYSNSVPRDQQASIERQRQDVLVGGKQRLEFLDQYLRDIKPLVDAVVSFGTELADPLSDATRQYMQMMSSVLTQWRTSLLTSNLQWEATWNKFRQRREAIQWDRITGGRVLYTFPWS